MGLEARGLVKTFRHRKVVNDVNVSIDRGEVVGLLGPNGAGKTTTFYMVVGLLTPDRGRILLDGRDITDLPMYRRCRQGIGYLPQESSVFRKLTVEENLLAILETLDVSPRERQERLHALLRELSLEHLAKQRAFTLSGGERRRLEITRASSRRRTTSCWTSRSPASTRSPSREIQGIVARLKQQGDRRPDHRPQRPRDALDHRPLLHPLRRPDPRGRNRPRARHQREGAGDLPR